MKKFLKKRGKAVLTIFILLFLVFFSCYSLFSEELSLEQAVDKALTFSGQQRISLLEEQQKQYALDEAKAKMFPTIDFQLSATYMSNPTEGITIHKGEMGYAPSMTSQAPTAFPDQDYVLMEDYEDTYFKIETSLDQPIFTWGKLRHAVELAKVDVRIAETEKDITAAAIRKQTAQTYFALQFTEEALSYIEEMIDILQRIVADKKREYDEEIVSLQAVLEARRNAAAVATMKAELEQAYINAKYGWFLLTGISPETIDMKEVVLSTPLDDTVREIGNPDLLIDKALLTSYEIEKLSLKNEQARLYSELEQRSGMLRPDFFLRLGMDITGQRIPFIGANWTDTWDANFLITLGTRIQLWDSGQSAAKQRQAAVLEQIAAEGQRLSVSNTEMVLRGLIQGHSVAFYRVKEMEATIGLLEEQYKNAEVSFENDLITRIEYLGAKAALLQGKMEYLTALLEYQNVTAELIQAAGLTGGITPFAEAR